MLIRLISTTIKISFLLYLKLLDVVTSADAVRLPNDWDEPLTTCPKWPVEYATYFKPDQVSPALGSSPLLSSFFNFSFSGIPEVVMFAEDHFQPRIVEIVQESLLTLVFSNYLYFADELSPNQDIATLPEHTRNTREALYPQLDVFSIKRFAVDDDFNHDPSESLEQRDLVMAMRFLTILAQGNGKLFTLNGYLHLGIARHLLAFGCKVLFITENTQISFYENYYDHLINLRHKIKNELITKHKYFIHVELPVLPISEKQQHFIVLNITKLIASKPLDHKKKYMSNFGFFHGAKRLENKIDDVALEINNLPY